MRDLTQEQRLIAIKTPLGNDELLLTSFEGIEYISDIFEFHIDVLSSNHGIKPDKLIGKTVTITIQNDQTRTFNGYISRFSYGEVKADNLRKYHLTMVPWLWFLSKTNNHRIFQNLSTKEIVSKIFKDYGFNDFDFKANGNTKKREYCVQHNESDLSFVSRLLEEEGIAYFFTQHGDKHNMVLVDEKNAYQECAETNLQYSKGNQPNTQISRWEHVYEFRKGKWSLNDYDYENPTKPQLQTTATTSKFANTKNYEHYEYTPYHDFSGIKDLTKKRIEAEETPLNIVEAASDCSSFYAGGKFKLAKHAVSDEKGSYIITAIRHRASDNSYISGHESQSEYGNEFTCIPDSVHFRPPLRHQKPVMLGPQSAIVVGTSGDEIYVDSEGRIKVQFLWDRDGKKNEKSTCYIRVMQTWAGSGWGSSFVPRVGMEVIVNFLDGDPDRPIVTGCVYNGDNKPPFDTKTQSGIKTNSSKGGGGWNEFRFDDAKDSEEIFMQAQKDYKRLVKNDEEAEIQANQKQKIKEDRTVTVESGNETIEIKSGDRSITVKNANSLDADTIELTGKSSIELKVGGSSIKMDSSSIESKVGGSSIKMDATGIEIKGMKVTVNGTMTEIKGSAMVTISGGLMKIG